MKNNEIREELFNLIIHRAMPEMQNVSMSPNLDLFSDIGYDSVRFIQLIIDIEEKFSFEVEDIMLGMGKLNTILDIENYVIKRIKGSDNNV